TTAVVAQTERRPMTTDDGLDMVRVGDALMSPDGEWVFYSQSVPNWEKDKENKPKTTYFMIPAKGGDAFQFIGKDGGSSFQFSPDGKYLSFKRSVDKKQQLFLIRTAGGEAFQLTKHKTSVGSYKWSANSEKIFFVASKEKSKEEEKKQKAGYDAFFVDEGPNGQQKGDWQSLWLLDIAEKKETRVTDEDFRIGDFDISPDGKRIVFTARYENRRNQQYLSEIYLLSLDDSVQTRLTNNRAPESRVLWAPDGKRFAYSAASNSEWELRQNKIWVMRPETRETSMVSGNFEGRISRYVWTPDGNAIIFTGLQRTNSNVYKLNVKTGAVQKLTNVTGTLSASSFSKDRSKMVYSFQDFDTPPDLFVSSTNKLKPIRLTKANPAMESELSLAKGQVIRWPSKDGLAIEGLLFLPESYKTGERLPLLLHIHGGPAGVFTNSFRYNYHVWAGLGYVQLCPNVRGSSGYSDDLLRGNMSDIGGGDYWDLMSGVDYVIDQGYADSERMGVRGWSYGGILGGWTITQTNRFKAASLGAMVADWTSEYGPGFNYDVSLWYIGGTPWDNPDGYRARSSLTHIKHVTTPTLLIHGMRDRTDTEPQSMMFFAALKDQGKKVRYLRVPREPHGFREPRHRRIRDIEEIRWMQEHVLGIEWQPWERQEKDSQKKKSEEAEKKTEVSTG
ncbi:MAG: prolyl oligopeptidase family serine peptidase, partial [bacterium]